MSIRMETAKADLRKTRWSDATEADLPADAARFRVDRLALTANNVTYGAVGDALDYWRFFPTGDDAWGAVPAWGFATVVESKVEGVAPGERFWGYWPIGDGATLVPARVHAAGFVDGAAHRRGLHGVYNHYVRCAADPSYRPGDEDLIALYRPLFTTSFLIDDALADSGWHGAGQMLIASASSKTAYGLAFCASERRGTPGTPRVVGLTSAAHVGFVRGLGVYDDAVAYDALESLDATTKTIFVDMRGSAAFRAQVHGHWRERLAYSCAVGVADWRSRGRGGELAGPRPEMFFAPAQAKKRSDEWGAAVLQRRIAASWQAFLARATDPGRPWLRVVHGEGREAVERTWRELLDGAVAADEGRTVSL